ncbi:MAG: DNA polymerase III subunit delta' [Aeromonadales bacterium]|nr:DNA polymerase III subunit delta' [Aeromonadales bacterium]
MYPWLESASHQLTALIAEQQLGHALLLKGVSGLGKGELAHYLAKALLCQHEKVVSNTSNGVPCGHCHACQLVAVNTHSDLHFLSGKSSRIGVDAIRHLTQVLGESARLGGGKVAVLEQADNMTEAAANALLKTLEEPPGQSTLILTTAHAERLLATIRSRCQQWLLPVPEPSLALSWLADQGVDTTVTALNLNQGSPLATRDYVMAGTDKRRHQLLKQFTQLLQQPTTLASVQEGLLENKVHLLWLQLLLQDALQLSLGLTQAPLQLADNRALSQQLSQRGSALLQQALTRLFELQRTLQPSSGRPVNSALQLGDWLNQWLAH